ncbi:hypothetical protein BKA66DRAFT_447262 [Pyrenochaeta sp. MPI-SDFR-AT-0127]|nr:hypothetical protein BKA66DRAFT_447262 [Pyrenochaeta sp. MPI-SDFR-AT-0127]
MAVRAIRLRQGCNRTATLRITLMTVLTNWLAYPIWADALIPTADFYRGFEAPRATHCMGGEGGVPTGAFATLVDWVEHGVAPVTLVTKNVSEKGYLLCLYPNKAVFAGHPSNYTAQDFVFK